MSIANTESQSIFEAGIIESNDQTQARVEHLKALEELVGNSYPNKFDRSRISGAEDTISNILEFEPVRELVAELRHNTPEGEKPNPELKEFLNEKLKAFGNVRISGRLAVPPRVMGKAAFVHLSDGNERLQIYVRKQDARVLSNDTLQPVEGEDAAWEAFKLLDHGDFIGAEGFLFLTNTGELSVHVETFQFLSKALLPMPDKMHGIADPELRRRFRYADLIASSLQVEHEGLTTREVFERRARLISGMRRFLDDAGYTEVETPMLTPKATGAAATPFVTHHNALDLTLYARIAPELYLKRLVVGGFEKVYELNRNFRNEGLSHKHNPEFTMLEFYCAYMDVNGMMDFAEAMIKESVEKATGGSLQVEFDGNIIDFSKFERLTMKDAVVKFWNEEWGKLGNNFLDSDSLNDLSVLYRLQAFRMIAMWESTRISQEQNATPNGLENLSEILENYFEDRPEIREQHKEEWWEKSAIFNRDIDVSSPEVENISQAQFDYFMKKIHWGMPEEAQKAKIIEDLFETYAEENLGKFIEEAKKTIIQPTFIVDYPKVISPLSKASPENPQIAERFELFIAGMECANGFSELNDPQEQYERFVDQMKARETGDIEAMVLDEDYIRALAYGMPPAAGIGIGIDRLVMLLTNRHSIRDVILFPHMRPITKEEEKRSEGEEKTEN